MSTRRSKSKTETSFTCNVCGDDDAVFQSAEQFVTHITTCLITTDLTGRSISLNAVPTDLSKEPTMDCAPPLEQQEALPTDDAEPDSLESTKRSSPRKTTAGVKKSTRKMPDLESDEDAAVTSRSIRQTRKRAAESSSGPDEKSVKSGSNLRRSTRPRVLTQKVEEGMKSPHDDEGDEDDEQEDDANEGAEESSAVEQKTAVKREAETKLADKPVLPSLTTSAATGVALRDLRQCLYKCSAYFGDGNEQPDDLQTMKERWRREQHERDCPRKTSALKEFHRKAVASVSRTPNVQASFVSFARLPESERTCECNYISSRVDKYNAHVLQCLATSPERYARAAQTKYAVETPCKYACGETTMLCRIHAHEAACIKRPDVPICPFCGSTFSSARTLNMHSRQCHHRSRVGFGGGRRNLPAEKIAQPSLLDDPNIPELQSQGRRLFCAMCRLPCSDQIQLINHAASVHLLTAKEEHAEFRNEQDFERWRQNVAEAENFKWVIDGRNKHALDRSSDVLPIETDDNTIVDSAALPPITPVTQPTKTEGVVKIAPSTQTTMYGSVILGYVRFVCHHSRQGVMAADEYVETMSPARLRQLAPCTCYIHATYSQNGIVKARYCLTHFFHEMPSKGVPDGFEMLEKSVRVSQLFPISMKDDIQRYAKMGERREEIANYLRQSFPAETVRRSDATLFALIRETSMMRGFVISTTPFERRPFPVTQQYRPRQMAIGECCPDYQVHCSDAVPRPLPPLQQVQPLRHIVRTSGEGMRVYHNCSHCGQPSSVRGDPPALWVGCRGVCARAFHRACINWPESTDPDSEDTVFYCTHECYDNAVDKGDAEMIDEEANEMIGEEEQEPIVDDAEEAPQEDVNVD